MQAACWYVLLLLQPAVYLVSREWSSVFGFHPNPEAKHLGRGWGGGHRGGRGRQFGESCAPRDSGRTFGSRSLDSCGSFRGSRPHFLLYFPIS